MTKIYNFLLFIYTYLDVAVFHVLNDFDERKEAWTSNKR